jgi:hypothetical protein
MQTLHTIRVIAGEFDDIFQRKQSFLLVRDKGFHTGDLVCLIRQTGPGISEVDHTAPKPEYRLSSIRRGGHGGLLVGYAVLQLESAAERKAA